jgi:apolipoprotein N-acyltransferase
MSWSGTTGISAVIAPDGRELARTAFFESGYLDMPVRLKTQLTVATRWGPVIQGLLVALGVGAVIGAILHNGWFVRRRQRRPTQARTPPEVAPPADGGKHRPPNEGGDDKGAT